MRILKLIFNFLLFFLVLGVGGFFIFRESMLFVATTQIQGSLEDLDEYWTKGEKHVIRCWEKSGLDLNSSLSHLQLRFVSDRVWVRKKGFYRVTF